MEWWLKKQNILSQSSEDEKAKADNEVRAVLVLSEGLWRVCSTPSP